MDSILSLVLDCKICKAKPTQLFHELSIHFWVSPLETRTAHRVLELDFESMSKLLLVIKKLLHTHCLRSKLLLKCNCIIKICPDSAAGLRLQPCQHIGGLSLDHGIGIKVGQLVKSPELIWFLNPILLVNLLLPESKWVVLDLFARSWMTTY